MDSRQVLDLIADCERRYPVADWAVNGLHVWPLMRVRAYVLITHHFLGVGARGAGMRTPAGRVTNAAGSLWRLLRNWTLDRAHNARPNARHQAVLLSDGVSWANLDGAWFDRFMDPVIAALGASGRDSLLLMPMSRPAIPRHSPSFYIQPLLDSVKAASTARSRLRPAADVRLDRFDELMAELEGAASGAGLPGRSWLVAQARRVLAMASMFEPLIGRTSARAAFVNTYYSAEGMAFVLAAKRKGCVTVDVQHGVGNDHVAYGGWPSIPPAGYEVLPDLFWVWGPDEADNINQGPYSHPAHRAVQVGNVWENGWRDGSMPGIGALKEQVSRAARESGARRHVLFTPGFGHSEDDFAPAVEAMTNGPDDILWWLRIHPAYAEEGRALAAKLEAGAPGRIETRVANSVPLPALLDIATANVTQASTTVLEARNAGVPSIITTAYGASIFRSEIEAGRSVAALTGGEVLAAIEALSRRRPAEAPAQRRDLPLTEALAALFAPEEDEACR